MATIKDDLTLQHRANLGEEPDDVSFSAGEEITILKTWEDSFLVKNGAGQLFNIPKSQIQE